HVSRAVAHFRSDRTRHAAVFLASRNQRIAMGRAEKPDPRGAGRLDGPANHRVERAIADPTAQCYGRSRSPRAGRPGDAKKRPGRPTRQVRAIDGGRSESGRKLTRGPRATDRSRARGAEQDGAGGSAATIASLGPPPGKSFEGQETGWIGNWSGPPRLALWN